MIQHTDKGQVYTSTSVVWFMLDSIGYTADVDLSTMSILEPCCGEGAFAIEIIRRLKKSSITFKFSFSEALKRITLVEIDNNSLSMLKHTLIETRLVNNYELCNIDFVQEDFTRWEPTIKYDLVVGNPPYVSWNNISKTDRKYFRANFNLFSGRGDLYIVFYEKSLSHTKNNGKLSFICSNRWFKTAYGKKLRVAVTNIFAIAKIIDLEKTNPFTSEVLGYPAITEVINKNYSLTTYSLINSISELNNPVECKSLRLDRTGVAWQFDERVSKLSDDPDYCTIESLGYTIKIGIATGKDKVFIVGDDKKNSIETDRLVPLVKAQHIRNEEYENKYVVNCFNNGRLISLKHYPLLNNYFENFSETLKARYVAKKQPSSWYRTIDKIREEDIAVPKILLPDISNSRLITLSVDNRYPHHNLYYITHPVLSELETLAAILSSSFILEQLKSIGTNMNGGYPRWQSQNLRKLQIPNLRLFQQYWKDKLVDAYRKTDLEGIDYLIDTRNKYKVSGYVTPESHYLLFEPS